MTNTPLYKTPDLWETLKTETRPIFLYGTGNGADKILDALLSLGVTPEGVFASDGFVRNRTFRDYPVLSYSSVREKYGDEIAVLLCFGTDRPEVVSFIEELERRHNLFIPDVPLYGGEIFDSSYLERNEEKLFEVREMLTDEKSKEYFDAVINFRLSGRYEYLLTAEDPRESLETLLDTKKIRVTADLGAYKGDTAKLFYDTFPNSEKIYAVEPDPKTFLKLCDFANSYGTPRTSSPTSDSADRSSPSPVGEGGPLAVDEALQQHPASYTADKDENIIIPLNFAASDRMGEVTYSGSASRGAGIAGKNHRAKETTVKLATLDSLNLENADFIKYDVEGDEEAALKGSAQTVKRCRPSLAVSLYHKTDDLFELPLLVKEMLGDTSDYTFHIRRPFCIPAWDITFYAVRKK